MRFSAATLLTYAAIASAAAIPEAEAPVDTSVSTIVQYDGVGEPIPVNIDVDSSLQKREIVTVIITTVATTAAATLTEMAIKAAANFIKNLSNWNDGREAFTKKTTAEMWAKNPDRNRYKAAICYNKGYSIRYPNGIAGKMSAKYKLGALHTDYDCMYMTGGGNQFYTHAEGGYINLSYTYDSRACSFDGNTGDLTCN